VNILEFFKKKIKTFRIIILEVFNKMVELTGPIKNVMFIKPGGLLLFSLQDSPDGKLDIISSFLEAIRAFSTELKGGELRSINLANLTLSYYTMPIFYIIVIHECDVSIDRISEFFKSITEKFSREYSEDQIKNWDHNITMFKPFIKILVDDIKSFSKTCKIGKGKEQKLIEEISEKLFKDKEILAVSIVNPSNNSIQTQVNDSLDDFELRVYISSSFYNRTIINLGTVLNSIGNILLEDKNYHNIIKTDRFYLGIKDIEENYLGILGQDYNSIKKVLPDI
jgi:hypothetical protein